MIAMAVMVDPAVIDDSSMSKVCRAFWTFVSMMSAVPFTLGEQLVVSPDGTDEKQPMIPVLFKEILMTEMLGFQQSVAISPCSYAVLFLRS
ncbi:MAG: hypothetical protein AAB489_05515, partial [Patescibacteria group bacterium]